MHDVVRMSTDELKELFLLTAEQMAMPPSIVEKDFWVVWTLDYLFGRSPWKAQLAFKGGSYYYDAVEDVVAKQHAPAVKKEADNSNGKKPSKKKRKKRKKKGGTSYAQKSKPNSQKR